MFLVLGRVPASKKAYIIGLPSEIGQSNQTFSLSDDLIYHFTQTLKVSDADRYIMRDYEH